MEKRQTIKLCDTHESTTKFILCVFGFWSEIRTRIEILNYLTDQIKKVMSVNQLFAKLSKR